MNGLKRKVHFVGVGGISMSGLAEILLNLGYDVSGSDLHASEITRRLEQLGLQFRQGHDAAHIGDAGILVVSSAVRPDNVEVVAAKRRGVPVRHRSALLADLMRLKPNAVAVGGTHGKTTTTSMVSAILDQADIGATSLVGGILHRSGTNARWGAGEYIVAEADEHDGSFLHLSPTISVVTNIDAEHLENYGTLDNIKRAFLEFCNQVPFYGFTIACCDDPAVRDILPEIDSVCITYGVDSENASLRGTNIRLTGIDAESPEASSIKRLHMSIDVACYDDRLGVTGPLGTLTVNAIGTHNARNALAACAVGMCLGMPFDRIAQGLRLYDGVRRRLHLRGVRRGVTVIEDYAHHPTEIASTLEAIRWLRPKRVVAVFQPHLFSRTRFFCDDFASILLQVDQAVVTDIYPSREEPIAGVDSGLIVDAAARLASDRPVDHPPVELIRDMYAVPAWLAPRLREGDVALLLGAGDINRIADPLLTALEET